MPETRLTYEIPDDDEGNENNLLNELEDAEELDEQIKQSKHHTKFKSIQGNAAKYLDELEHRTIEHNRLRPTQVMAAMGFTEWIKNGIHQDRLMGHIVQPPGAGKTTIAIMLSEMAQGRTVVIGYNKPANLIRDFRKHEQSKELGQQRAIGQCFGGTSDITQPVTVAHFESFKKKLDSFNWSDVNLIIVDEADINALSPDRAAILTELAENYGIPVIGMSATEEQASGKKLQDVFPDEVTRLGMPDSLPLCLKMGIAPAMSFSDLYLELTMELDGDELKTKKDLPSEEIESFIHSTEWISLILDHYTEQFQKEGRFSTGMIVFRDNGSVETCLKEAQKRGIKAASLTGDLNDRLRRSRQEALAKGDLDLLVGSQLIGRGLHIPQVEVVYNSTITWSPQLFWQADGRAASINPDDLAKKSHIFAVLPKAMKDRRTGELLRKEQRPLCHAAFFNPAYYEDLQDRLVLLHEEKGRAIYQDLQGGTDNEKSGDFELGKLTTIRTIGEVTKITKRLREKPIDFKSRSRIIAEYLDALNEIDMRPGFIRRLLRSHTHEIKTNTDRLVGTTAHYEWTLAELRRIGGISPTPKSTEVPQSMLRKLASNAPILSRTEEVELLMEAHAENNVAIQILIESHLPLILSMTRHFKSDCIDENDLAQVAIEELIKVIRQKRISTGLSGYVLMSSYHAMSRYVAETERDVRIGLGPREKVRKVLQVRETQSLTIRSLYDGNVSLSAISDEEVHEELGITQEDYYKIIMGNLDHQLRILELHNRLKHFLKLAESYIPMELPDIYLRLKGQKSGKNKAGVRYEMMGLDELCSAIEVDPMELERLLYMDRKLLRSELSKHSDIADSLPFSTLYISDTEKIGKFYRRKNIRASVTEDLFYSIRTDNQSDMNIYLKAI
ncbi:MAG: helicase-related protein, partial [Candidatus Peregrinibacteria bacterium]|nr:helicase-related protein [Candidatus Peregrinibacteria bacterium]